MSKPLKPRLKMVRSFVFAAQTDHLTRSVLLFFCGSRTPSTARYIEFASPPIIAYIDVYSCDTPILTQKPEMLLRLRHPGCGGGLVLGGNALSF